MVIVGTGTSGTRFLKRDWPITEGLEAGTTKQEGTDITLEPEHDLTEEKERKGIN